MKLMQPGKEHFEKHYADLADRPYFPEIIAFMISGPVCAMVWEGDNVIKTGRKILGTTNPVNSNPGTIRGDHCLTTRKNCCHGSDSIESAQAEIKLWFPDASELVSFAHHSHSWVYE